MGRVNRGEIWLLERPRPDKRRPVVILARPSLIPFPGWAKVPEW